MEVKNRKATLLGPDTLAGSSANLLQEVKNLVSFGISLEDAIYTVTAAPAKTIGLGWRIGKIAPGYPADLLLLTEDLELDSIYVDGKRLLGNV